jgi:hypothetical protein
MEVGQGSNWDCSAKGKKNVDVELIDVIQIIIRHRIMCEYCYAYHYKSLHNLSPTSAVSLGSLLCVILRPKLRSFPSQSE